MIREASLSEMRSKNIPKDCHILVNRGCGNDELAPADALFAALRARKKELEQELGKGSAEAHNQAFLDCAFERRFREQIQGDTAALGRLAAIAARSETEDVYLVCYEGPTKACHRRMLMRIAEEHFDATVALDGIEPA